MGMEGSTYRQRAGDGSVPDRTELGIIVFFLVWRLSVVETKQRADVTSPNTAQGEQCCYYNSTQVCFCDMCCPTDDYLWRQLWLFQNDKLVKCC